MDIIKTLAYTVPLVAGMSVLSSCKHESDSISLRNTSSDSLYNKSVVLNRSQFDVNDDEYILIQQPSRGSKPQSFNNEHQPSKGSKPLEGSGGDEGSKPLEGSNLIPVQFDDLDRDGTWDEAVFTYNFLPNETVELNFKKGKKDELPEFPAKANVYLGYSSERNNKFESVNVNKRPGDHVAQSSPYLYQYEGPGWESELVAFRLYFDSRNGKDIFGKTKAQLYVDSIGLGENYHLLQDWGMDILKVGASLGAGSLALLKDDSLYRLTDTQDQTFEIIADGPVRGIFKLTYEGWDVGGTVYDLEETITIWGGNRWYESQVRLTGGSVKDTLVTGIVDLHHASRAEIASNQWQIRYLHGKASENKDYLGMGLLIPEQNFAGFDDAPRDGNGITNTALAYLVPSNELYKFAFYVGWEGEDSRFSDQAYFENQLIKETEILNNNLEIKIIKK